MWFRQHASARETAAAVAARSAPESDTGPVLTIGREETVAGERAASLQAPTVGAFGFAVDADVFGSRYLYEPAAHWPRLDIEMGPTPLPPAAGDWRQVFDGPGWEVQVRAGGDAVRWGSDAFPPSADFRVHPLLSLAVCAATLERGGDCLHAGAVSTPDGVVVVLAPSGGGKTSTMAWLALEAGLDVLTDDHLNLRNGVAYAGPRCMDLRPDAADALGLRQQSRLVRQSQRCRFELGAPRAREGRVIRTIVLAWGDEVRLTPVRPRDRLAVLATHRTAQMLPGDLAVPLALAGLPMQRLERPKTFDCMPEVERALLAG